MMKKKYLILPAFFLFFISSSYCQRVQFGVNGSLDNTWLLKDSVLESFFSFGNSKGLMMSVYFDSNSSMGEYEHGVSLGVLLTNHNQHYIGKEFYGLGVNTDSVASVTRDVKLKFIAIPLLFRMYGEDAAYFELGPQLSFLQGASEKYTNSFYPAMDYSNKDVKATYKPINISGVIGLGKNIETLEQLNITLGVRVIYGITNINKIEEMQAKHTLSLNFMAGIYYNLF